MNNNINWQSVCDLERCISSILAEHGLDGKQAKSIFDDIALVIRRQAIIWLSNNSEDMDEEIEGNKE